MESSGFELKIVRSRKLCMLFLSVCIYIYKVTDPFFSPPSISIGI